MKSVPRNSSQDGVRLTQPQLSSNVQWKKGHTQWQI